MMVCEQSSPKFDSTFSDVDGRITIIVNGESFLLHKSPLVAQSGKIRKLLNDATTKTVPPKLELQDFPGGPKTFELAAKFCYGFNLEITKSNVGPLHCAAHYLEMTAGDYNLLDPTEAYLTKNVFQSLGKSVEVLLACEDLLPFADEIEIPSRCISAISRFARSNNMDLGLCVENLSTLGIDFYNRVITAMGQIGVGADSIAESIMHYAQTSLKGIGKPQIWNPARKNPIPVDKSQRRIVELLVNLLPHEEGTSKLCIPLSFLFGMTRMCVMVGADLATRVELEKRIADRLEMASLDDMLIPSLSMTGDSLLEIDTIHRILVHFLHRVEEENGYESEGNEESCLFKVGRLVDSYLAEIAPDPYLRIGKFVAMIEVLPDYARIIDDGLYRAIDIYLKAHPKTREKECKKLCRLIDCEKLSLEACNHAARNERLPAEVSVRVVYFEQVRLRNALLSFSGSGLLSRSGVVSEAAVSPRDTYACLRRENRELKMEISRMRVRLTELEKLVKQGKISMKTKKKKKKKEGEGSKANNTIFTTISKGIVGKFRGQQAIQ
ncbi:BTB/POZ domain-containing protein [Striga hermonthica]|uniref:BTB/POZ domain-containing protein n=1 Tax=Striga hermonthica TaxID=68872 RepID=A0A9N7NAV3_STRHE|nr:BTB/POZ domain-containing protein [Striga hermonthica]